MNKISLILSALLTLTLVVLVAPNIFALNQGKILRNIALWLAIFLGLVLVYRTFGPDSPHPLFTLPPAMQQTPAADASPTSPPHEKADPDVPNDGAKMGEPDDSDGYNPPSE